MGAIPAFLARAGVLAVAFFSLVAATPSPTPCPSANPPQPERRHASGLTIVPPLPRCFAGPPVYEPLAKARSDARYLAESHPDDFGYPWDDRLKKELVVSVMNARGEVIARDWMAKGFTYGFKSTFLPPPEVPVRFRTVTRSYAQLERLKDEIIEFTRAGVADTSALRSIGSDDEHNRVVIDVQTLSDGLATALAARFGTEAIAVRVDPTLGPFTTQSGPLGSPGDPPLLPIAAAVLIAGSAVVFVLLMKRARRRRPA